MIPLEDNFDDILGKAQRGLRIPNETVAEKAGISVAAWRSLKGGDFNQDAAEKVAPVLGLGAQTLVASGLKSWYPDQPDAMDGFVMVNTPFGDMTVNAYLIWDPKSRDAALVDTGADCSSLLETVENRNLSLKYVLLTHAHIDHVVDLAKVRDRYQVPVYVNDLERAEEDHPDGVEHFSAGREFSLGSLRIETLLTSGHSAGGTTYVVHGLPQKLAIAGDSIFAGSMGGGMVSYEAALANNREKILTLPGETILACGHGPLTTVSQEKAHNPFFT